MPFHVILYSIYNVFFLLFCFSAPISIVQTILSGSKDNLLFSYMKIHHHYIATKIQICMKVHFFVCVLPFFKLHLLCCLWQKYTLHFITAIRRATVYKCKKCRMALATTENILPHWTTVTSAGELELITWPKMLTQLLQTETQEDSQKILFSKENHCKIGIFLEPLQWMNVCHAVSENQTLHCSKCHTKLGSFSWSSSIKCGCGAAMAPAFFIHLNKVDKCTMHKEIEAVI